MFGVVGVIEPSPVFFGKKTWTFCPVVHIEKGSQIPGLRPTSGPHDDDLFLLFIVLFFCLFVFLFVCLFFFVCSFISFIHLKVTSKNNFNNCILRNYTGYFFEFLYPVGVRVCSCTAREISGIVK